MSNEIRLLLLTAEAHPTFRADVAVLFGKYLPQFGVYSDLATLLAPDADPDAPWAGGRALLKRADGGAAQRRLRAVVHGLRALLRADSNSYTAIQVRDMPVLAAAAVLVARWKRLPLYYWMSFPIPEGQIELARERRLSAGLMKFLYPWVSGRTGRWLLRHWVLPRLDHLFVQSAVMQREAEALGVAAPRIMPVPMGVDLSALALDDITPIRDPRLAGRRVIGYLGTLDRARRIERLFDMLALVRRDEPAALLVLVGDTEDTVHRRWLHEQAELAGVAEHVIWTGWLATREAWRWLRTAEVGLSPVPRGPLLDSASPTKVPEYLALGLPVVCNDNPDQQALIETSGAGRCVPYTAPDFARAVLTILALPTQERARMAQAGRRLVREQRDYRRIASAVAAQYDRLAQDGQVFDA